nr:zinc finger, CCHC-type [Tanacetum cinerariifolium]
MDSFQGLTPKVPHHGLDLWLQVLIFYDHVDYTTQTSIDHAAGGSLRKLRPEEAWETIEDLAQYKEKEWNDPIISEKGSPNYIDVTLKQELESIKCQVEFTFPKRPCQKELEGRILDLIDHQDDQVKIEAQRVYSTEIEKITRFPTHTSTVTPKIIKPTMVHRVSMISKIEPTNYRTPHQHVNSDLKMPILYSFEENKLEYKDEDEVEIKMMRTKMDKESLEHNLYENDITLIICHNFSPTSNPPIKPKDSGSFRMNVVEHLTIHTPPLPHVA